MDKYRQKEIKDIIAEFPGVAKILEEYGIGCGPCTVGICQLKETSSSQPTPLESRHLQKNRFSLLHSRFWSMSTNLSNGG